MKQRTILNLQEISAIHEKCQIYNTSAVMAFNYEAHPMKKFSNLGLILPVLSEKVWAIFVYNGSLLVSM